VRRRSSDVPRAHWHDLRAIRAALIALHAGVAVLCLYYRPHLFELIAGYAGLAQIMPTRTWGLLSGVVAALLAAFTRPGVLQVVAQLSSGALLSIVVVAVSSALGPNLSTVAYATLGGASIWSFYRACSLAFESSPAYRRLRSRLGARESGRHG